MSQRPRDPFQYDRWPAGTYNDGWKPWTEQHRVQHTGNEVTADPRKGTGLKQWAQPRLVAVARGSSLGSLGDRLRTTPGAGVVRMTQTDLDRQLWASGRPGAPPPPDHVRPPCDWRCLVPGCQRRDLPTGHSRCVEHRGGIPYDQPLSYEEYEKGWRLYLGANAACGERRNQDRMSRST